VQRAAASIAIDFLFISFTSLTAVTSPAFALSLFYNAKIKTRLKAALPVKACCGCLLNLKHINSSTLFKR
jgi:hypothetical protein